MIDAGAHEIKQEWDAARKQLAAISAAALTLLATGAIFFHYEQDLSWIDAFYFCTISLTTVGYGDITPESDLAKIFITFYILIGIGIIATFGNLIIKSTSLRREYKRTLRRHSQD